MDHGSLKETNIFELSQDINITRFSLCIFGSVFRVHMLMDFMQQKGYKCFLTIQLELSKQSIEMDKKVQYT